MCACEYVGVSGVRVFVSVCARMYVRVFVCLGVCMCVNVCLCVRACMRACICGYNLTIYIHPT